LASIIATYEEHFARMQASHPLVVVGGFLQLGRLPDEVEQ